MIYTIESDRCAKHKVKWVYAACNPPVKVCPKCPGGKKYLKAFGKVAKPKEEK